MAGRMFLLFVAMLLCLAHPDGARAESSLIKTGTPRKSASLIRDKEPTKFKLKKQDIIKILLDERVRVSISDELDTEKNVSRSSGITTYPRIDRNNSPTYITPVSLASPQLAFTSAWEVDGEGDRQREDRIRAEIAAKVVEVKPNGNAILEAKRFIQVGEEQMMLTLTAEAAEKDIGEDRAIKSSALHDLNITQKAIGAVAASSRRGWLTRLIDMIDPF